MKTWGFEVGWVMSLPRYEAIGEGSPRIPGCPSSISLGTIKVLRMYRQREKRGL